MTRVIIDINEETFKYILGIQDFICGDSLVNEMFYAIHNGIVLPKGHGRLIDTNALIMGLDEYNEYATFDCNAVKDLIDEAPTMIEADRGIKNENN